MQAYIYFFPDISIVVCIHFTHTNIIAAPHNVTDTTISLISEGVSPFVYLELDLAKVKFKITPKFEISATFRIISWNFPCLQDISPLHLPDMVSLHQM